MNVNELQSLWASAENGLSPEKARGFASAALAQVDRERRRRRGMLIYIGIMVPLTTGFAGWQLIQKGIAWGESWPAILILTAQWFAGLYLLRIFRRSTTRSQAASIRETLETLCRQAKSRCRELQTLLGLFLVVTPLVSVAIHQLQQNGKMRPHEAASASLLFAAILVGMAGWFLFELFARKLPEKRYLESLLRDYREIVR